MKKSICLLALLFASTTWAQQYECLSKSGLTAQLTLENANTIHWYEINDSSASVGQAIGREEAPFSEQLGYYKFQLTDFYMTEDSSYIVALESLTAASMKAVRYFDHDDHSEQEDSFFCVRN